MVDRIFEVFAKVNGKLYTVEVQQIAKLKYRAWASYKGVSITTESRTAKAAIEHWRAQAKQIDERSGL